MHGTHDEAFILNSISLLPELFDLVDQRRGLAAFSILGAVFPFVAITDAPDIIIKTHCATYLDANLFAVHSAFA